jgi:DNA-directed RNA polymerase subunit beta'
VYEIAEGNQIIEPFADRLVGRYPVDDVLHPDTGDVIVAKGKLMNDDDAERIIAAGIKRVQIRSVLSCRSRYGVCAKCYGSNLAGE